MDVCNGGHIFSLSYIQSKEDLDRALGYESKAILIVGHEQWHIRDILSKLLKVKKGLRARKLCRWSGTATLWMVRK
jgi:hypothetical protein